MLSSFMDQGDSPSKHLWKMTPGVRILGVFKPKVRTGLPALRRDAPGWWLRNPQW